MNEWEKEMREKKTNLLLRVLVDAQESTSNSDGHRSPSSKGKTRSAGTESNIQLWSRP